MVREEEEKEKEVGMEEKVKDGLKEEKEEREEGELSSSDEEDDVDNSPKDNEKKTTIVEDPDCDVIVEESSSSDDESSSSSEDELTDDDEEEEKEEDEEESSDGTREGSVAPIAELFEEKLVIDQGKEKGHERKGDAIPPQSTDPKADGSVTVPLPIDPSQNFEPVCERCRQLRDVLLEDVSDAQDDAVFEFHFDTVDDHKLYLGALGY